MLNHFAVSEPKTLGKPLNRVKRAKNVFWARAGYSGCCTAFTGNGHPTHVHQHFKQLTNPGLVGFYRKVNLIRQLFSHHRHPQESATATEYIWLGQSGKKYPFQICPLDAVLKPLPGVYIYARELADGDWDPVYIAQTRDLHQRLEGHVTIGQAVANGATHLHVHYCGTGQAARCDEEHDLVNRWQPVCNDHAEV